MIETDFALNLEFESLELICYLVLGIWCSSSLRFLLYAFSESRYRSQRSPQQATT